MRYLLIICCLLLAAGMAGADTIQHQSTVALTKTNWTESLSVAKFDSSLGTLQSVLFILDGHVEGNGKYESLDGEPADVTMDLYAKLSLFRPDNSLLVVTMPGLSIADSITEYDEITDFGGTSGRTYLDIMSDKSEQMLSTAASDLSLFTASYAGETITLPVWARANSIVSGAGNLEAYLNTYASANVSVVYNYAPTPAVPEASSILLSCMGLPFLGVGMLRRRK